jgi:hypothetical protein
LREFLTYQRTTFALECVASGFLHSVVDSLKVMFLTLHTSFELKSLDYSAITIEFVNCLPTKFNGDILFELPFVHHRLGNFGQLQSMDRKYDGHVWCKL